MLIFFGIIIWGIIWGAVCRITMSNKGYDSAGWFFCGFFLGLIGLIICACQPSKQIQYGANPYSANQYNYNNTPNYGSRSTTVCKSCGATNSSSSFHCQSCGAKLSPAVSARNTGKEGSWKCLCGAKNFAYENACHRCGASKHDVLNNMHGSSTTDNYWTCGCGTINFNTRNFCKKCGHPNPNPITTPTTNSEEKTLPTQLKTEQKSSSASLADQLKEFKSLLDQGLITEADFEAKKKQILGI